MISQTTTNRIIAVALLLAAVYLLLSTLRVFRGQSGWVEFSVIAIAAALLFIGAVARLRRRIEKMQAVKSTRASMLKHLWELRHRREW